MKAFLKGLVAESSGVSMMRVMSLMCIITACGIAIYGVTHKPVSYEGLTLLCGGFLSAGFTGKYLQKKAERKAHP